MAKQTSNDVGLLTKLIFGKLPAKDSATFNYQERQNKLLFSSGLLVSAFWIGTVGFALYKDLALGITAAFAILYFKMHQVAAMQADAVFDSLWERINLQSRWLNVRLTVIENAMRRDAQSGQSAWQDSEAYEGNLADAWHSYPEMPDRHEDH